MNAKTRHPDELIAAEHAKAEKALQDGLATLLGITRKPKPGH
jgi:hypothetical protein